MGLYVLFFGTKVKYKDVPHHSIIFCKRFRELLSDIFNAKHLSNDFSLYLHRPTATDINFAPNDCDSFYVLSPVPNLALFNDWDSKEKLYRKEIINYLEKRLLKNLKQNIVHEFSMTPNDFENDYLSYMGSGFSLQPTLSQSAWFRYHNKTSEASNLYLVVLEHIRVQVYQGIKLCKIINEYYMNNENFKRIFYENSKHSL